MGDDLEWVGVAGGAADGSEVADHKEREGYGEESEGEVEG